jgi:hypothetical protein
MSNLNLTTPVGRLVMGSLYKPDTTDMTGKPLVVRSGPNAGQPKVQYFFAVAIPKEAGHTHWAQTVWGKQIWNHGHAEFPAGNADNPSFAWKIVDGDSQVLNENNRKPCDREGYPGNWVISFTSGFASKICNKDGSAAITEPDAIKLGYYVQVNCNVAGNGGPPNAGIFINPSIVALSAYGEEISYIGADPKAAGFGAAPLPQGATTTPPASFVPPVTLPPVATPPPVASPVAMPPPNPAFLTIPPARVMTAKAQGGTYEAMIVAGWTDELLLEHGMMVA